MPSVWCGWAPSPTHRLVGDSIPVDALKIAGEFTQEGESETATRSSALAAAIVAMARSLGIETVAEGIETRAQADRMRALRCTYGQGYFFAQPLLPDELPEAATACETAMAATAEAQAMAEAGAGARRARRSRRAARAAVATEPSPA